MRYRVNALFWLAFSAQNLPLAALVAATGSTAAAIYRVRSGATQSGNAQWRQGAITLFPESLRPLITHLFTPIGEDRYRCKPRLWGLLAERRIKLTTMGEWIGASQQRMSTLRRNPTHTV